ncbi:MAG: 3-hydroxyacyl-CoA dehydrogenase family protein [Candidatus Thorarchaeota archaeon]
MVDIGDINNIAVIGAGIMGRGIAQLFLMAGFNKVIINDFKMELIEDAAKKIESNLIMSQEKGKLNEGITAQILMGRLVKEPILEKAIANVDFIIEVIPEILELKQELFKKLGQIAPEHAILASNSSTMSITEISKFSGRLEKAIGMHFNLPPLYNSVIEVIKGEKTSNEAFEIGISISNIIPSLGGRRFTARIEKECPGHVFNRINASPMPYLYWIVDYAYDKGIQWQQLDADVIDFMNTPPYLLFDYIGLDTVYYATKYFEKTISPDFTPSKILTKLYKEGNLGRKTGRGFYEWTKNGKPIIDKKIKKAGLLEIELFWAIQLNEGCRLLEKGIVSGYKIIDDIMLAGMNVPGPFASGRKNYEKWSLKLKELYEKTGKKYFIPCKLMTTGDFIKMRK